MVDKSSISPEIALARSFARKPFPRGTQEIKVCPVCGSEDRIEDYLGGDTNWAICRNCSSGYKMHFPTDEEVFDYYRDLYRLQETGPEYPLGSHRRTQVIRTGRQFALIHNVLKDHNRYLDYGCALGWGVRAAAFIGLEAYGVEPGELDREFAQRELGITLYATPEELPVRDFDLMTMSHVLEHFIDPIGKLREFHDNYLADFARIIIEVPTVISTSAWSGFHAVLFNAASLTRTIEQAGMRVELLRSYEVDPSYPKNLMWAVAKKG